MIKDADRSHFFGASDARHIFSENREKKSWLDWWETKKGGENAFFGNKFTRAGNMFEHSILKAYNSDLELDRQIIIEDLRLRVNLDGNTEDEIVECKTYRYEKGFKITEAYMQQAQLQMYAWNNELDENGEKKNTPVDHVTFVSYGLLEDEYNEDYPIDRIEEGTLPINPKRMDTHTCKISRSYQRRIPKILKKLAKRLEEEEYRPLDGCPFEGGGEDEKAE